MFDFLTVTEWSELRNWLGTTGGVVALLIGALTYRRNVKIKREEQARLVYSKITHVEHHAPGAFFELLPNEARIGSGSPDMQIVFNPESDGESKAKGLAVGPIIQATAVIHNGSKELIGPARIQMVNRGRKHTWDEFSINVGAIDPEAEYVVDFTWINTDYPGEPGIGTTVIFRDASGQWWRRHLAEPIKRVYNDPENSGPTPTERVQIRAMQVAGGFEPLAEHKLTLPVRWHRFWRKRQGKSPIP